jgi:hypothetical protein
MENTDKAPRVIANAVLLLRDLRNLNDVTTLKDVEIRNAAEAASAASYDAASTLEALGYDEAAFTLNRVAEICTGLSALTLGAMTRLDGEVILADTPYREAMFKTMVGTAYDLQESALRDAAAFDDSKLFEKAIKLL